MEALTIGSLTIAATELSWSASRASGPGGQNVNKVASKVELRFDLANNTSLPEDVRARLRKLSASRLDAEGKVVLTSQKTRDQHRNLEDVRAKLAALVLSATVVPKPRKATKPSKGAERRRIEGKKQRSAVKENRKRVDD